MSGSASRRLERTAPRRGARARQSAGIVKIMGQVGWVAEQLTSSPSNRAVWTSMSISPSCLAQRTNVFVQDGTRHYAGYRIAQSMTGRHQTGLVVRNTERTRLGRRLVGSRWNRWTKRNRTRRSLRRRSAGSKFARTFGVTIAVECAHLAPHVIRWSGVRKRRASWPKRRTFGPQVGRDIVNGLHVFFRHERSQLMQVGNKVLVRHYDKCDEMKKWRDEIKKWRNETKEWNEGMKWNEIKWRDEIKSWIEKIKAENAKKCLK